MYSLSEQVGEREPGCNSHVLGSVWEVIGILRSRVLRAVRGGVADDHHDGTVRKHPFGNSEEVDAVVGDEICEIILGGEGGEEHKYHHYGRKGDFQNNTSFDKILFNHHGRFFLV